MEYTGPVTRSKGSGASSKAPPDAAAKAPSTGRKTACLSARQLSDDADDTKLAADVSEASAHHDPSAASSAVVTSALTAQAHVMSQAASTSEATAGRPQQDIPSTSSTSNSSSSPTAQSIKPTSCAAASGISLGDAKINSKVAETDQATQQEDEASAAAAEDDKLVQDILARAAAAEESAGGSAEDCPSPSSSCKAGRRHSGGCDSSESFDVDDYESSGDEASEEGEGMWVAWLRCRENRVGWGY